MSGETRCRTYREEKPSAASERLLPTLPSSPEMRRAGTRSPHTRDDIPMVDYPRESRTETLQKIHAHSSAETSGLGDSLQRIHTLSSTETSGLGDTVPSPNGLASPSFDGQAAAHKKAGVPHVGMEASYRHQNHTRRGGNKSTGYPANRASCQNEYQYSDHAELEDLFPRQSDTGSPYKATKAQLERDLSPPEDREVAKYMEYNTRGSQSSGETPLCQQISIGNSLVNEESTWMKWSHERKESFKKRINSIEQKQKELEKNRVSTPVKKARKESVVFISPDVGPRDSEQIGVMEPLTPVFPIGFTPRARLDRNDPGRDAKLTVQQWNAFMTYWDHDWFIYGRYVGLFLSLIGLVLEIVSGASSHWIYYNGKSFI